MLSILPYKGGASTILDNCKKLGLNPDARIITPEETREKFHGVFRDANFQGIQEFFWDPSAGWADAASALTDTIQATIDNGVNYVPSPVKKLSIQDSGCSGVELADGTKIEADKILLATGAETARLLADSAPREPALHVGPRFVAGAITVAKVKLSPAQIEE